jgi:hypothetical protein
MKKITFLLLALMQVSLASLSAQKLSEIVRKKNAGEQMSPVVVTCKNVLVDDANGYLREFCVSTYKTDEVEEKTESYIDWCLWKTTKSYVVGTFSTSIFTKNGTTYMPQTNRDGETLALYFMDSQDNIIENYPVVDGVVSEDFTMFDEKAIFKHYNEKLASIEAKGAEGTETLYAEMPRKGTTIKLHIVYGSELKKNKGLPTWKMPIGELQFNKTKGNFTFVKL